MRLLLERVSTRRTGNEYGVFDEATGKCVGTVSFDKVPRRRPQELPHKDHSTVRLQVRASVLFEVQDQFAQSSSMTAAASGGV
jgi:hypothetical protein